MYENGSWAEIRRVREEERRCGTREDGVCRLWCSGLDLIPRQQSEGLTICPEQSHCKQRSRHRSIPAIQVRLCVIESPATTENKRRWGLGSKYLPTYISAVAVLCNAIRNMRAKGPDLRSQYSSKVLASPFDLVSQSHALSR